MMTPDESTIQMGTIIVADSLAGGLGVVAGCGSSRSSCAASCSGVCEDADEDDSLSWLSRWPSLSETVTVGAPDFSCISSAWGFSSGMAMIRGGYCGQRGATARARRVGVKREGGRELGGGDPEMVRRLRSAAVTVRQGARG